MDNKTKKVPTNTITRDTKDLAAPTGNIYESVVILYKRAQRALGRAGASDEEDTGEEEKDFEKERKQFLQDAKDKK